MAASNDSFLYCLFCLLLRCRYLIIQFLQSFRKTWFAVSSSREHIGNRSKHTRSGYCLTYSIASAVDASVPFRCTCSSLCRSELVGDWWMPGFGDTSLSSQCINSNYTACFKQESRKRKSDDRLASDDEESQCIHRSITHPHLLWAPSAMFLLSFSQLFPTFFCFSLAFDTSLALREDPRVPWLHTLASCAWQYCTPKGV